MKAYLVATAILFALLTVVHIWRVVEEGPHLATDPFFVSVTVIAAVLCGWAIRLLQISKRS